ncbi:MAG: FkbM family methyltransferase [Alphaproteobacteria bacterium]
MHDLTLSMRAVMTARRMGKKFAKRIGGYVDYDLHLYEAIESLRQWSSKDIIFDVGANDGRTVSRLMNHLPSPKIYAFEPVTETYRLLVKETSKLSNVIPMNLALGTEVGKQIMYLNDQSVLSSLYPEWSDYDKTEEIDITTVDSMVDKLGIDSIALLKIDAEGHDFDVVKGAENSIRSGSINMIQVEAGFDAPGWRKMPSLWDFRDYLDSFGYYLHGVYNQCKAPISAVDNDGFADADKLNKNILVFCDALFVRHGNPNKSLNQLLGLLPGRENTRQQLHKHDANKLSEKEIEGG